MKYLFVSFLISLSVAGQVGFTPIANPIQGDRIIDAIVFRDTLYLTAEKNLWSYDGNSFSLKRTFLEEIGHCIIRDGELYVFNDIMSGLSNINAHRYNGLWTDVSIGYFSAQLHVRDVISNGDLVYFAGNGVVVPFSVDDFVAMLVWNTASTDPVQYGGENYTNSLSVENGVVTMSGNFEDSQDIYCIRSSDTLVGDFSGGVWWKDPNKAYPSASHVSYKGGIYAYGAFDTAVGTSLNYNAYWDGTAWTPFNHPIFDTADCLLSMSTCDHLIFAFPGFYTNNGTSIKIMYGNEFGWNELPTTFFSPVQYPTSNDPFPANEYHLRTITYQGNVYLFGDKLDLDSNQVFNKFGRLPEFIGVEENQLKYVNPLFPNPTSDFLSIDGIEEDGVYRIYNAQGAVVQNGFAGERIDVRALPAGIYIFQLQQNGTDSRQRFIKVDE